MSQNQTHAPPKPPPPTRPEVELLKIIRAALDDESVQRNLLAYAQSKVGYRNAIQAEDLVQEACERAWKKAGTYDPDRVSPELWIHGFLRNIFRENCRSQSKAVTTSNWSDLQSPASELERGIDISDARFRVQKYFEKLPLEFRAVIRMKYFEDADGSEMAKRLGISHENVRTRIYRAMNMLRSLAVADKQEGQS